MKQFLVLFGILWIPLFSCEKEKNQLDPNKAILGKWEIVEMGNWPDMDSIKNPLGYQEYLPDSILLEYIYETKTTYYKKYWLDESLLYRATPMDDGSLFVLRYKYQFSNNNNKLKLNIQATTTFRTSTYKRIN